MVFPLRGWGVNQPGGRARVVPPVVCPSPAQGARQDEVDPADQSALPRSRIVVTVEGNDRREPCAGVEVASLSVRLVLKAAFPLRD